MSDTRWSARAESTKALVKGYDEINAAFKEIADNVEQTLRLYEPPRNRHTCAIWHHILDRFHSNSQVLQSADQDLNTSVAIYESLMEFILKLRTRFEDFEASVNVTITRKKLDASVNEIVVTMSQDQHLNCRRLQPTSFVRAHSCINSINCRND